MTSPDEPTPPPTFAVGWTYSTRSIIDHEHVTSYAVVARTAKFITIRHDDGHTSRVGVKTGDRGEWALPEGSYSMAPVIHADRNRTPTRPTPADHQPAS